MFNTVFMMLDVLIGSAPFEWRHLGVTYVFAMLCEPKVYEGRGIGRERSAILYFVKSTNLCTNVGRAYGIRCGSTSGSSYVRKIM